MTDHLQTIGIRKWSLAGAVLLASVTMPNAQTTTELAPVASEELSLTEGDDGFIVNTLNDLLANEYQSVRVTGLQGALSGRATLAEVAVIDADGPWLIVRDVVLDWNRLGLLRGRLSVNELSAAELIVARAPLPAPEDETAPAPEASSGFALPELPVAVLVSELSIDRVSIGAALLGQAAELDLLGAITLDGGILNTQLLSNRLDRAGDRILLDIDVDTPAQEIGLNVQIQEAAGGLVGTLLNLPKQPSIDFVISGAGRTDDLIADITLKTDDETRLSGQVELAAAQATGDDAPIGVTFDADVGGDIRALLPQDYQAFFGPDTRVTLDGETGPDGRVQIDALQIATDALSVEGSGAFVGTTIETAQLDAMVGNADDAAAPVTLPFGGGQQKLGLATLILRADESEDRWSLGGRVRDYLSPAADVASLRLVSGGTFDQGSDGLTAAGDVSLDVDGLNLADPKLAQAVGDVLRLSGTLGFDGIDDLTLNQFILDGTGYRATADAQVQGIDENGNISATATVEAGNLAQFRGLAGLGLAGSARSDITANFELLTGAFKADLTAQLTNGLTGIPQVDPLLVGDVLLSAQMRRDANGIALDELTLSSDALDVAGNGTLSSGAADIRVNGTLDDLARLVPDLSGMVDVTAKATQSDGTWRADVDLTALDDVTAKVSAEYGADGIAFDIDSKAASNQLTAFVPAELLPLSLSGGGTLQGAEAGDFKQMTLRADVSGSGGNNADVSVKIDIDQGTGDADIRASVAGLNGLPVDLFPLDLTGKAQLAGDSLTADLDLRAGAENAQITARAEASMDGVVNAKIDGDLTTFDSLIPADLTPAALTASATRDVDGRWQVDADATVADAQTRADISATYTEGGASEADVLVQVNGLGALLPPEVTPMTLVADGSIAADLSGAMRVDLSGASEAITLMARGDVDSTGSGAITVTGDLESFGDLLPDLVLPVALNANAKLSDWTIAANADVTAGEFGTLTLGATRDAMGEILADLSGQIASLGGNEAKPFLPIALTAQAEHSPHNAMAKADLRIQGPQSSRLIASATMDETSGVIKTEYDLLLDNIQRFIPQNTGQITMLGASSSEDRGKTWYTENEMKGPNGSFANASGDYDAGRGMADLRANGTLLLALLNPFLSPDQITGSLDFEVAMNGPLTPESLSGTIQSSGTRFDLAALGQEITGIDLLVELANDRAQLSLNGGLAAGGTFSVSGPLSLLPPYDTDIAVALRSLVLTDNLIFESGASGDIRFSGALMGRSQVQGRVDVAPTTINLANIGGGVGAPAIPEIDHLREEAGSLITRERARLVKAEDNGNTSGSSNQSEIGLDLQIIANQGVEVRGLGLDAKLGGAVGIGGTMAAIVTRGAVELQTGTLAILGRPLRLTEGRVSLNGLTPFVNFSASSASSEGTATITVSGPLDQPVIDVTAVPERPPEEALALLLFGNRNSQISPFKIAQLAAQIASGTSPLFGAPPDPDEQGGIRGIISNANQNIYTDFTVNADGENEVNLSLDVTDSVTLRGAVDDAGSTSLGMFFQRDY